jgi:cobalt-precorrin 5A hydrolase/precorrin-3B C17-methyltransferase
MKDPTRTRTVAVVAATTSGRRLAERVAGAWPHARLVDEGSIAQSLQAAWSLHEGVIAFVATGIVVRVLAPLLVDKHRDPPVVVIDDTGRHVVPILGGHEGGANLLASQVAQVLGAEPVLTTATDVRNVPGLDLLGWPVEGALGAVTRAMLEGEPVHLRSDEIWPLPALPDNVRWVRTGAFAEPSDGLTEASGEGDHKVLVTDRLIEPEHRTVVLRPPSLVIGVGASRGVGADEVCDLISRTLGRAGLAAASIACLATVDVKAGEIGIVAAARRLGVPLMTHPAGVLAQIRVPNPSAIVTAAVGTPSVAEAAALCSASTRGMLLVPKTASAMATVAIARAAPRGRLAIVGLGPGARDLLTPRALAELRRAAVVVGLDQYVDQIRDLLRPGTRILATGLGAEEARARSAVKEAQAGHAVALIGSGDAGVFAMASPALDEADDSIDVVGVPGVTAGLAAAALLGAPLGHDHVYLSLSDLNTPWPVILTRIRAAAVGDFVVLFYNPRSLGRAWQLGAALAELAEHRPPGTPVAVVRQVSRPDEQVLSSTLQDFDPNVVDMSCLVVVGSSQTRTVAGRMVTPRGYHWRESAEADGVSPEMSPVKEER